MCGIFGYIGTVADQLASRCLDTLAHRGPDGRGLRQLEGATLGHRRLSILDLSEQGGQPMCYAAGRYWITYNGEIYNFLELRAELEGKGYRFLSESDTEVVLAAFHAWGEACLDRFNGMWAFAIWDSQERALFLSRDRLGKKPLFYAELPAGEFAFASEMKALLPLLPSLRANEALVRDSKRIFLYESTEECLIEGLKRFPAGHCGWLRQGKLSLRRWWCTLEHLAPVPERYEEQVEQFRELFLDACRLRMRSDVPLGTALSGGLDSSSTISAMAHLAGRGGERMGKSWQHAFVAAFPGTALDETRYARMVTDHLGIQATVIETDPLRTLTDLDRQLYLFEELYITTPFPFMATYGAVKEQGISVTLDGHGADELFGGYHFEYVVALRDAGWDLKKVRDIVGTYYDHFPKDTDHFGKLPTKVRFVAEWHARCLVRTVLDRLLGVRNRDAGYAAWQHLDYLARQLYHSTHHGVLPTLLRNYDRYSMANGVEIRMPFLDHRILSFAFSLPWSSKIRNGFSKAIIRDAMASFLPREVVYRKTKIGFHSPLVDWMQGPLRPFIMDTVRSRAFRECTLVDPKAVAQAVVKVVETPGVKFLEAEKAWTMLMPYLWERAVLTRRAAPA